MSVSALHSLVLDKSGELFACGSNTHSQVGLPHKKRKRRRNPITIMLSGPFEDTKKKFKRVPIAVKVLAVAGGCIHSIIIDEQLRLWGFGSNEYGQ
jgi:alpha-tubulin suppressor-like RCC1 family protein